MWGKLKGHQMAGKVETSLSSPILAIRLLATENENAYTHVMLSRRYATSDAEPIDRNYSRSDIHVPTE